MSGTKVLGVVWFGGRSTIGIVKVEDEYDGIKYLIGACQGSLDSEADDIQYIVDWGSHFPQGAGQALFDL